MTFCFRGVLVSMPGTVDTMLDAMDDVALASDVSEPYSHPNPQLLCSGIYPEAMLVMVVIVVITMRTALF